MLSLITQTDGVSARARFRKGASLPWSSIPVVTRDRASEMAAAGTAAAELAVSCLRPQLHGGAVRVGAHTHVAAQANSALQQPTSQKFAYPMTLIAAVGGGAVGPHPARDPV